MPSSQYQERLNHHIPADQQVSNSDVGSGNRRQNDKEPAQAECSHGGQVSEQLDEPQEKVEHAKDEADPQEAEIQGVLYEVIPILELIDRQNAEIWG